MREQKIRLKKFDHLADRLNGVLLANFEVETNPDFLYLTNFSGYGIFYYDFSSPALFVPDIDLSRARKSWTNVEPYKNYESFVKKLKRKKIGVSKTALSAADFSRLSRRFRTVDVSKDIAAARSVKTPYEISRITRACALTRRIMDYSIKNISRKMTEIELKAIIEKRMLDMNVERSFPTIVATGKNITEPHHTPGKTKLDETTLIDMGVKVESYCSDMTRTVNSEYEEPIERTLEEVYAIIKPGVKAADLHKKANDSLGALKKHFITSLGHGIGLEIHENPVISLNSKDILKESMTVTIEPGVYMKNGIRTEDDIVITRSGFRNLTR